MKFLVELSDTGDIRAITRIGDDVCCDDSNEHTDEAILYDAFYKKLILDGFDRNTSDYLDSIHMMNNDLINTQHRLGRALRLANESEHAKDAFVSRLSHDIRTPLGIITAMTDFAMENIDEREKLLENLQNIKAANTYLTELISDMLELSKIDNAKMKLHPAVYMLDDFISDINSILIPLCSQRRIDFNVCRGTTYADYIYADRTRLNQLALNFLSNAVKYTPVEGKVEFEVSVTENDHDEMLLQMRISDTGIGMSEEFQSRMFEPFSQESTNPLRETDVESSGLGLSIAKKITDLMGGTIKVSSELSRGTTILVTIPFPALSEAELTAADVSSHDSIAMKSSSVLFVDDNEVNRQIGCELLGQLGLNVTPLASAEEAIRAFEASDPDEISCIFMDIRMPGMSGFDGARAIRDLSRPDGKTVAIIALTADADAETSAAAQSSGMDFCLTKPLDQQKIRELLHL